jgi:hypothetical protein
MSVSFCIQKVVPTGVSLSYDGFHSFRHRVARSCGIKDVYPGTETDLYETGRYKELEGSHPMTAFLEHSDCDGSMGPDDCGQTGMYLKEIIKEWNDEDPDEKADLKFAERLVDVMLKCYEERNSLLFI